METVYPPLAPGYWVVNVRSETLCFNDHAHLTLMSSLRTEETSKQGVSDTELKSQSSRLTLLLQ